MSVVVDWLVGNAVLLGSLAAVFTIGLGLWAVLSGALGRLLAPWRKAPPIQVTLTNPDAETRLTIVDFIRIRRELKAEILAELDRTDVVEERTRLQARIDELTRQINDPESALAVERRRLADLEQRLIREGNELGAERLQSAVDALRRGETDQAEAIFAEIVAREALAVQRTARAEYGLGEIAEGRVDWTTAAHHYARAAELDPNYDTLIKAGELLWRAGRYEAALGFDKRLVALALAEHGPRNPKTATALNNCASSLRAAGRYTEAEPLFRDALAIGRETLGPRHPDVAIHLNNFAGLLEATGRHDQAEPLYREALEISRETLGPRHPDVARGLNNLALLLRTTGRYDQAGPLFREALEISRETHGPRHPHVATTLNNLAGLLEATGRYDQAEPLYREALEISRETLGPRHPLVANPLHNLAGLLRATGRAGEAVPMYLEAVEIVRASLGDAHPDTRLVAGNTLIHLREHAPDHPDLPALAAAFPDL